MTNKDDLKDEVREADNVTLKKRSVAGRVLRIVAWVVAVPLLLILLLGVLLYIPPVQQWAVDTATGILSEETGMDVKVGEVRLKFPLDLSLRNTVAIQDGDTVLDAGELLVSVRLQPLLKQEVEVDCVTLRDVKVDTRNLVEAMRLEGYMGEFTLDSHTTSLERSEAVVSHALLADADLTVTLADSVAEDTAVSASEPVAWVVRLDDVRMKNVGVRMALAPQKDSVVIGAHVGDAFVAGFLDLEKERYDVHRLRIDGTSVTYDMGSGAAAKGVLDPQHIALEGIGVDVDSVSFDGKTGKLGLTLNRFVAKERSGLAIVEGHTRIAMDSVALKVDDLILRTENSKLAANVDMDMNAFDENNPGRMNVDANMTLGWGDVELALGNAAISLPVDSQAYPTGFERGGRVMLPPLKMNLRAEGNMKRLAIRSVDAEMNGALSVRGRGEATNLTDLKKMGGKFSMKADVWDVDFVKGWMPADAAASFSIPKNMLLLANAELVDGVASADANLHAADAIVMMTANYGLETEHYKADVDISNLVLNKIVKLEEELRLAGSVSAEGHGFDFYSPETRADVTLLLDTAKFGRIDVSSTNAHVSLDKGKMGMEMACDNDVLQTELGLTGSISEKSLDADLDLQLPFVDFKAMGLSEKTLEVKTNGRVKANYNWNELFKVDAFVRGLDMRIGKEKLLTDDFKLYAESMPDSTAAVLKTGDLSFDFRSPNNLFALIDMFVGVGDVAMEQIEAKSVNLEEIKKIMPVTKLRTDIGTENPVTKILALNGMSFDVVKADLRTSPENGLTGWAHVFGFKTDSIRIDTLYCNLVQDSTRFNYKAGIRCDDQKLCPGFSAVLDGYIAAQDADAHLTYVSKKGKQGMDLGVKAFFTDSVSTFNLYPNTPTIAFNKFDLNGDNFVSIDSLGRIYANVDLHSKKDSCRIYVKADPEGDNLQDANAVVENLNLGELLTVLPFMPKMDGLLNLDANYVQDAQNFTVSGELEAEKFKYEGASVGDLKAVFDYAPMGEFVHDVKAELSHNDVEFAELAGSYNGEAEGELDADLNLKDLPMSMLSAFVPDQMATFSGDIDGNLKVQGAMDKLLVNGSILPDSVRLISEPYAVNMLFANTPITFDNSRLRFNRLAMYGTGKNPLTLNGYVDFADFEEIMMSLSLYGQNFQLIDSKRTRKSIIFGEMYGDFLARVNGTMDDLSVRGMVNVLNNTDMTYVMTDTPLSIDYRLEDIVTFVDFNAPPDTSAVRDTRKFMGMDLNLQLNVEDGAEFHCEFSADRQSYVNVQGGGSMVMTYTPEGVLNLQGRYTINEGEMKYTLPVIPLKTFTLQNGSYIDFTGDPMNPMLNIAATERTKASVATEDGKSRSVTFDVGLKITNTLSNMGLEFTIAAPEDLTIQNELASMSLEEKNKLAVAMLATGMYLSGSNSSGFNAGNALNNFLQNEINNIAGQALSTAVDVNVGMEQSTRDDGSTKTDYSFKFSKRLFSDRLNIVIGGKVNADGNKTENESGAYIDDVSLEWRLDNGGTRYVRLFHEKNYDNLIEGELIENGAGVVLRKKLDRLSELFIFKK